MVKIKERVSAEMDINTVKEIVSRYYDHHDSKYVFGGRKSNVDYFYNTERWDWYFDYWTSLESDFFKKAGAPHNIYMKFYDESVEKKKMLELDMLVALKKKKMPSGYMDYITLVFHPITGIEFRSTYGKPAMKVKTTDRTVLNMHLREDGELYWSGFNNTFYYFRFTSFLNRLLMLNERFRNVLADIFMMLGEEKKILKDVARTIRSDHYFANPIKIHDACKYRTPDELIRGESEQPLMINYNRRNMNYSWYVTKVAEYIKPADRGLLLSIPKDEFMEWIGAGVKNFSDPVMIKWALTDFLIRYYANRLFETAEDIPKRILKRFEFIARDYGELCIDTGELISLRKTRPRALENAHDAARDQMVRYAQINEAEFKQPLLAEDSKFLELKELLPDDFKMIDRTPALYEEGERQHNCVFNYRGKVRNDDIAIFHWDIDGREYTIEFGRERGAYCIRQMMQKYNRPALPEDVEIVRKYLEKN